MEVHGLVVGTPIVKGKRVLKVAAVYLLATVCAFKSTDTGYKDTIPIP